MSDYKTDTPVVRNDFIRAADRTLVIQSENTTLTLAPDNPVAGAVAFLDISFESEHHRGSECISLDFIATKTLRDALTALIDERAGRDPC